MFFHALEQSVRTIWYREGGGLCDSEPAELDWQCGGHGYEKEAWQTTSGYRHGVLKQRCFFFDPLNEYKHTCHINPFTYVRTGSDHVVGDVRAIADALVVDADGGEGNQWSAFARKLFTSLALLLLEAGPTLGWKRSIGQVYRIINSEDDLTEVIKQAIKRAQESRRLSDECRGALLAFVRQPEKQREGTITTLDGALQLWQSPLVDLATSASDVDFRTIQGLRRHCCC